MSEGFPALQACCHAKTASKSATLLSAPVIIPERRTGMWKLQLPPAQKNAMLLNGIIPRIIDKMTTSSAEAARIFHDLLVAARIFNDLLVKRAVDCYPNQLQSRSASRTYPYTCHMTCLLFCLAVHKQAVSPKASWLGMLNAQHCRPSP